MESTIRRNETVKLSTLGDYAAGEIKKEPVMRNHTGEIMVVGLDQGRELPEHKAPGDVMVQGLSGEVEFVVAGKRLTVTPGEVFVMEKDTPHAVKALSKAKFLLTIIKADD